MSKRFIDTGLFDDPWFMDLSKDAKLLWVYMITKCNHAGIIELNKKLAGFQIGIKDLDTVIKELRNRLVTVKQDLFFIPKYIDFQYPNFPQSAVQQQKSAIEILSKLGLFVNGKLTVAQELPNSYDNDNDNVDENEDVAESLIDKFPFETFWELYNKKVDKEACKKKFSKLSEADKEKILTHVPLYVKSTPDVQYRKNPETYLNNKCWQDEALPTGRPILSPSRANESSVLA